LNITPNDLNRRYLGNDDYRTILRNQSTPNNPANLYDEYKETLKVMVSTLATEQARRIAQNLGRTNPEFALTRRLLDKLRRTRSA
jgi:hypothetical protein